MSEKEVKALEDNEIDEVAGGSFGWSGTKCDVCKQTFGDGGGLPLTPYRDICDNCIKKYRSLLGDTAFEKWVETQKEN